MELNRSEPKIIAKTVGSELMLYNQDLDEVHILNPTAQLIYALCKEGKTIPEIEREVHRRYPVGVEAEQIKKDIESCLQVLRDKALISRAPTEP